MKAEFLGTLSLMPVH